MKTQTTGPNGTLQGQAEAEALRLITMMGPMSFFEQAREPMLHLGIVPPERLTKGNVTALATQLYELVIQDRQFQPWVLKVIRMLHQDSVASQSAYSLVRSIAWFAGFQYLARHIS